MNRRTFLATMTAATLLSSRLGWTRSGERKLDKIGLELYTVRDLMKSDFEGTLAKVAEIGYREVEFAGLFDHTPREVRAMLDRHGLTAPASHVKRCSRNSPCRMPASRNLAGGLLSSRCSASAGVLPLSPTTRYSPLMSLAFAFDVFG